MYDSENMFSWQQPITAAANSTNVVFTGKGSAGGGQDVRIEFDTPAVTGGGTLLAELQHADTDAGTFATVASFTIGAAALARGGAVLVATITSDVKDYLRLKYTPSGTVTGLVMTAGLLMGGQTNH